MKKKAILYGLLSALLFGAATPVCKILLNDLNPFQLAGFLYIGAAIGVFSFLLINRETFLSCKLNKSNILRISGSLIFGGIAGPVLLLFGLSFARASSVSLWLNFELAATSLLGVIIFKDHLNLYGWLGVFITIAAGILITFTEQSTGIIAVLFISSACICWGFDNHFTALIDGITPAQTTFIKGIAAGFINLIIGFLISGSLLSLKTLLIVLTVGMFSYGISILLYILSAQNLGATRSQILFSTAPFFGYLLSIFIFRESVSYLQIISVVLMVSAIFLIKITSHSHYHKHKKIEHIHPHKTNLHHTHKHTEKSYPLEHSHLHIHKNTSHIHEHFPDLHHRHDHK